MLFRSASGSKNVSFLLCQRQTENRTNIQHCILPPPTFSDTRKFKVFFFGEFRILHSAKGIYSLLNKCKKFYQVKSVKRKSSWNVFPPKVRKSLHYGKEENCDGWRAVLQMSVPFPFSSANDIYLYLQTLNLLLYVFLDALASLRPVLCHSLSD